MEKTFNKIVLSQVEPNIEDLWMRINIEKLPDGKAIHGHSLWWFTSRGWKKLFDFDTRYSVSTNYSYSPSQDVLDSTQEYDPRNGIVSVNNVYNLYNATREIGDNANLVTERGLKYHVDDLQKKIDDLRKDLNSEISNRKSEDNKLSGRISSLSETVQNNTSRISALESAL